MAFIFAGLAWGFTGLVGMSLWQTTAQVQKTAQAMHRVPCPGCQFFTGDYSLKCTVHPYRAGTEDAINCRDFES
jgi:hypothetical protein